MKAFLKKIDFITLILVIVFLIVFYCYAQLKIFKKDYINFCGYTVFQVVTGSMADTIEIKDIILVKITNDVEEDDIITFKSNENFITHRIINKDGNVLITKGDANNSQDEPIHINDVIGKVVFIFSNIAVWENVLKTPEVILAIILTILIIWILFFKKKKDVKN